MTVLWLKTCSPAMRRLLQREKQTLAAKLETREETRVVTRVATREETRVQGDNLDNPSKVLDHPLLEEEQPLGPEDLLVDLRLEDLLVDLRLEDLLVDLRLEDPLVVVEDLRVLRLVPRPPTLYLTNPFPDHWLELREASRQLTLATDHLLEALVTLVLLETSETTPGTPGTSTLSWWKTLLKRPQKRKLMNTERTPTCLLLLV